MPQEDIRKLRFFIDTIAVKSKSQDFQSQIGHWLNALDFYFYPEKMLSFLNNIKPMSKAGVSFQEAFSGNLGLWTLNRTFISAIDRLPQKIKLEILKRIHEQVSNISLDSELMSMKNDTLFIPYMRTYRRNLEVMVFLLLRNEIEILKAGLTSTNDILSIKSAIEKYYNSIDQIYVPQRGGYSAQKILDAAHIIQLHFKKYLNSESDFIDLYGSFPNGKATFKTSDIDIKLSDDLLTSLTKKTKKQIAKEPFSLFFSDMITRNKNHMSAKLVSFWNSYQQAERALGERVFNRKPAHPSELLTILYPPRSYSNDIIDFRWYNPIVIRIYKDKMSLQIVDLTNTQPHYFQTDLPLAN